MHCICGNSSFDQETRAGFVTDESGQSLPCEIPVAVCATCGLVRQEDLPFDTEEEYGRHYTEHYPPGSPKYIPKVYAADLHDAGKTFERLKLSSAHRLLDLGCGSGALVEVCRKRGIEAYGCELVQYHYAPKSPHVYYRKFEEIHFPTDHFDRVVCADVVEHVLDPVGFLREVFRVTDQNGTVFLELPLFFHPQGKDHWKRIEHLWYFTPSQFERLLKRVGFTEIQTIPKEETKIVFSARKPSQSRVKLLLPPGVGDVYWPLVKTQAFLKREGITPPVEAYVAAPRAKKYDSHARAFPFLAMFPFLHSTGECLFNQRDAIWQEAYLQEGRSIFENVLGCDYFLSWNGHQRAGKNLEDVDPDLACNWSLPRFISLKEEQYREAAIVQYGKYLVLYWVFQGTNGRILNHFSVRDIAAAVQSIVSATGLTPVLVGAAWDRDDKALAELSRLLPGNTVNLLGKTTLEELFGLIRGSRAVVGMDSGITIMAAVFGIKTVLLIHDYLTTGSVHKSFAWNTRPPAVRRKTYFAEFAEDIMPAGLAARAISVIQETPYKEQAEYLRPAGMTGLMQEVPKPSPTPLFTIRALDEADPIPEDTPTTIACILKAGGDFEERHVVRLRNALARNLTLPYEFVCLTDRPEEIPGVKSIEILGSWNRLELFRPGLFEEGRVIYFDLDTLILQNIDDLLSLGKGFHVLRPWDEKNRLAGLHVPALMAWESRQFGFLYQGGEGDDRECISRGLMAQGVQVRALQDEIPGIYSYKRSCVGDRLPRDARIVCFLGRPRLHECKDSWVEEAWR